MSQKLNFRAGRRTRAGTRGNAAADGFSRGSAAAGLFQSIGRNERGNNFAPPFFGENDMIKNP
jgi:hypothetical protein